MKNGILIISSILIIFLMASCGSGGGSDSTTVTDDTTTNDDTTTDNNSTTSGTATFTQVFKIIQDNCFECHDKPATQGAPMSLTTHTEIAFFADSTINRINLSSNSGSFMPKGSPKLSVADIATIEDWVTGGKLDN